MDLLTLFRSKNWILLASLTWKRQHFLNVTYLRGNIFSENKTSFKNDMKSETKDISDGFSNIISIKILNTFGFFNMKKATLFKCYLFKRQYFFRKWYVIQKLFEIGNSSDGLENPLFRAKNIEHLWLL